MSVWSLGNFCLADQSGAPGVLDETFNPVLGGLASIVYAVEVQPDGKILIGGDFGRVNDVARSCLARLHANGSVDSGFSSVSGADRPVHAFVVQEDGRIVVGGDFYTINGASWRGVARLLGNGTPDPAFGQFAGANGRVLAVAVQPGGKIVLGGAFTQVNGVGRAYLARLNADGSLDAGFNPSPNDLVQALALRPSGGILAGGSFTTFNGLLRKFLVQLTAEGALDNGFGADLDAAVYSIALQTNAQVVVAGEFTRVDGAGQNYIARLNADGSRDGSFTANSSGWVYDVAIQPDGKLLMAGRFTVINGVNRTNLARLNQNGLLDPTFNPGAEPSYTVRSVALQSDGRILLGGEFTTVSGVARTYVARVYGDPPPPLPVTVDTIQIRIAVEVGWPAESNVLYRVQWSSEAAPAVWHNYGEPIAGQGGMQWIFDTTRESPRKFYRVLKTE